MLSTVSVQKLVRYGQLGLLGTSNAATTTTAGTSDAAANTNTLNYASFIRRSYVDTAKKVADGADVSVNVAVLTSGELWKSALDSLVATAVHARTVPDGLIAAAVFTSAMCAHERSLATTTAARKVELNTLLASVTSVISLLNRSNTSESLLLAQCFATLVNVASEMCLLDMGSSNNKASSTENGQQSVPAQLLVAAANQFQRLSGGFLLPKVFAPKLAGQQLRGLLRLKPEESGVGSPYQYWSLMQRLAVLVESDALDTATKISIHDLVAPYLGTRTARYFVYLRGGEAGSGGGATGSGRSARSNASGAGGGNGPLIGGGLGGGDERMVLAGCKDIAVQSSPLAFICTPPVDPDVLGELLFLSKVVANAGTAAATQSVSITSDQLTSDAIRRSFSTNSSIASKTRDVSTLLCSWAASVGLVFDGFCDSPSWSLFAVEQRRKVVAKRLKDQERQSKKALKEQEREVQRKIKARAIEALVQARAEEAKANLELRTNALNKNAAEAGSDDDEKMSMTGSNVGSTNSSAVSAAPSWAFSAGGMSRAESDVRSMMSAASFASYSTFLSVVDSEALDREHREQHESADGNSNLPLILMEMGSFALYQCIEAVREEKLLIPYFQQIFRKDASATAALAAYSAQLEGLYTALWRAVTDLFASAARRMRVGLSTGSSGAQVPFFSLADDVQYNCGLGYQSLGLIFARLIVPSLLSEATEDRLTAPPPFMGTVAARARRARIALSSLVTESPELATQFRRDLQRTEASHMAHALVVYETVAPQVINQNIGAVFTVCCRIAEDESCEESTREGFSTLMRSIINRLGQANQLQLLVKAVVDGVAKRKGSAGKDAESDDDEDEQDPEVTAGVVEAEDRKLSATLSNLTTLQQTAISTSEDAQTLLSSAAFRQAFASAVSDTLDTEALLVSVVAEFQRAMTCTDSETCVTSLVVTMHMISITLQGLNPSTFASFPVFEKLIELEVAVGHELLASVVAPALFGTSSSDDGDEAPSTKAIFAATSKKVLRGAFVLGCEVLVRVRNAMLNCMSDLAVESLKDVISMINETVWRIGAGAVPTLVGTAPADDDDSSAAALTTDSIVGCVSKSTITPLTGIHFSHVFAKLASQRLYMYDQIAVLEGTPAAPEQHRAAYATFVSEQNALRVNDGGNNKHPSEVYTLRITAEENFHLSHANTIAQTASPSAAAVSATSLEAAVKQTIANSTLGAVSFMNFLEASSSAEITKAVQAPETDSIPIAKLAAILAKSVSTTSSSNGSKVVCGHLLTRFYNICASAPIQTGSTSSKDDNKCSVAHGFIREILNLLLTSDSDSDDSSSVRSALFSVLLLGSTDSKDAKPVSYILPRHTHRFPTHPLLSATTKIFKQLMKYALNAVFNGERSSSSSVHLVYARAFAVLATQYVPIIFERDTVATMVAKAVTKTTNDKVTTLKYDALSVDAIVGDVAIFVALDTIAAAAAEKLVGDAEENSGGEEDSDDDEDEKKQKKKGNNNKRRAAAESTSVYGAPIKALLAALQLQTISTSTNNTVDVCVFESSPQLLAGHVKHTGFVYTTMYALVSNTMHDAISHGRLSHALRTLLHLRTVPTVAFSNLYPCVLAVLSQFTQQLTASSSTPAKTLAALRNYRDGALELSCYPLVSFFTGAMGGAVFSAVIGTIDAMIQVAADLLNNKSISIAEHVATIQHVITTTSHIVAHHPNVVFGTRSATLPCLMRSIFQGVMRGLEAESTSSSSSSSSTSITAARGDAASALVPFNTLLARCTGTVSGNSGASSGTTNFDDAVSTSVYTCNAGTGPRAMVCAAIASALLSSVNKAAQLVMFSSHSEQFDMLGKELLVAMGRARLPRASVARCVYVASQAAPQAPPIGFKRAREENTKKDSKKKEEGDDEGSNSEDDENDQPSAPLQAPSKSGKKLPIIKNRRRLEASKIAANSLTARTTYVSLCYAAIGNTDGQQLLHQLSLRVNDETGRSIFNVSK